MLRAAFGSTVFELVDITVFAFGVCTTVLLLLPCLDADGPCESRGSKPEIITGLDSDFEIQLRMLQVSKSKTSNVLERSSGKNKEVRIAVPKTSNVLERLNVS